MIDHVLRRWVPVGALVAVITSGAALLGRASAEGVTPRTIGRDLEPVIVTGANLRYLEGAPSDSLFVYAHRDDRWQQIPFQVDEKVSSVYTSTVGSPLDSDDEIVFMASDLGDRPSTEQLTATLPISPTWYRIEVTDSLSPTLKGWAYVVRSSSLTRTFTQTYTSFVSSTNQITTTQYALGLVEDRPYFDHLALNDSGVNVLDRSKIRIHTRFLGTYTEEAPFLRLPSVGLIKDGPVRVIARGGGVIGYRSMVRISLVYTMPTWLGVTAIRVSTDFNEHAVPSTFYNANTPEGVPIDGSPDAIAEQPLSLWGQVSGATGSLVQVSDVSQAGGTPVNYYKDDVAIDEDDTGDQRSYGDAGIRVDSPNPTVVYQQLLYVLPPEHANVGELYAAYATHPMGVTAIAPAKLVHHVHLPLVFRD